MTGQQTHSMAVNMEMAITEIISGRESCINNEEQFSNKAEISELH